MPPTSLRPAAAFLAGAAAASVAWAAAISAPAEARSKAPTATVVALGSAPTRTAPNGKATVRTLAHGSKAFVAELRMDASAAVPEHRDTDEEYIVVLEGGGTMHIDDVAHTVRPGTAVFMPEGAKVRFQNGPEPMRALQVFAGPGSAAKYDRWQPTKPAGAAAP